MKELEGIAWFFKNRKDLRATSKTPESALQEGNFFKNLDSLERAAEHYRELQSRYQHEESQQNSINRETSMK